MSPRTWLERIKDILTCAKNIRRFCMGMSFQEFLEDERTVRAVAFELTTIGEAVRALPEEIQVRYPDIPWEEMKSIRNVLVHEYFRIDEEILWQTVQEDIPPLISSLEKVLKNLEGLDSDQTDLQY